MLTSMTGFGEAQKTSDGFSVRVELRAVNNRHFKLASRLPDGYAAIESKIESCIRETIRRGSLNLTLQVERESKEDDYRIDEAVLTSYYKQLTDLTAKLHDIADISLSSMLLLPGVVSDVRQSNADLPSEWPFVEAALREAVEMLCAMRAREGKAMADDLMTNCDTIESELQQIKTRSPQVLVEYETRLLDRINQLLQEHDLQAEPSAVIREVAVFADRVDTSEEVVRLQSHLDQFRKITSSESSPGRKLEFLNQELLREANTIGSKANDAQVARHVVQIKTAIERMREMIQNVE